MRSALRLLWLISLLGFMTPNDRPLFLVRLGYLLVTLGLIDGLRMFGLAKKWSWCQSPNGRLVGFLGGQYIQLLIIIALTQGIDWHPNQIGRWLLGLTNNQLNYDHLKLLVMLSYISISGANFVPLVFDVVYKDIDNYLGRLRDILVKDASGDERIFNNEKLKTGKWIGILERMIMVILIYLNSFASIGFVIAVKSLTRFKLLENKIFSEYYLIGTLTSVLYAFLGYGLLEAIL